MLPLFGCISVIVMTSCCCWSQCTSLLFPCSLCFATWCSCAPPSNMWFLANKCLSPMSSAVFMAHQCARHTPHTQETMQCATSVAIGNICAVGPNNLLLIFFSLFTVSPHYSIRQGLSSTCSVEVCIWTAFLSYVCQFLHPLYPFPPTTVHFVIYPHPSPYQFFSVPTQPHRCSVHSLPHAVELY